MIEIGPALTSAAALLGIARGALDARDDAKVREALTEMQQRLLDAMSGALDMASKAAAFQEAAREAQDELRVLKAKAEERDAYTLAEIRSGAYAYARKNPDGGDHHKAPYFCQPCYDNGVKAILRLVSAKVAADARWECPTEKQHGFLVPNTAIPWKY